MTTIITEGVSIVYLKLLPFIIFITGNMLCMETEKKLHCVVCALTYLLDQLKPILQGILDAINATKNRASVNHTAARADQSFTPYPSKIVLTLQCSF